MDSGYATFLNLLHRSSESLDSLSKDNVHGAIAHYAQTLPVEHLPVLIRAIVTSPALWSKRPWDHLIGTQAAFRQAARLKLMSVKKVAAPGYIFGADLATPMQAWVKSVLNVMSSIGDTLSHLHAIIAIVGGLSLGLGDIHRDLALPSSRNMVDRELALNCADAIHYHSSVDKSAWGSEFSTTLAGSEELQDLTICLIARVSPSIPSDYLGKLNHAAISSMSLNTIRRAFGEGTHITFASGCSRDSSGRIHIPDSPRHYQNLATFQSRNVYESVGSVCHLLARSTLLLAYSRPELAWNGMQSTTDAFDLMSSNIERIWTQSLLSGVSEDAEMPQDAQRLSAAIWEWLKTFLFCTLIVMQSHVTVCSFHSPPRPGPMQRVSASMLACSTLAILHNVSFIGHRFGGSAADGSGIPEQKRVLFGSLDIVASDFGVSESLLTSLLARCNFGVNLAASHPLRQSRAAFFLACTEQLVPCLSDGFIETSVVPFAQQYLDNPTFRETFEMAHSVILAIFANNGTRERNSRNVMDSRDKVTTRLAPFCLNTIIYNAPDGRLSSEQLQLAFTSLVRGLSASEENALAWHCIQTLIDALHASSAGGPSRAAESDRLRLTLISSISAVNIVLLPRLLKLIDVEVLSHTHGDHMKLIADQVLSHVGDAQKDIAISWWMEVRDRQFRSQSLAPNEMVRPTL